MRSYSQDTRLRTRSGFTLIELLTVIAIIGILAAILIPTVGKVRNTAKKAQCVSRLRQWGNAVALQANDFKSTVILGYIKHPSPPQNSTIEYILDLYFNSGGNVSREEGSGKETVNKSSTRAYWGCPTGINGGNTLTAGQYAFVVPAGVTTSPIKPKFLGADITNYYALGKASSPSKLVLMIEVKNAQNNVDVPAAGGVKNAVDAANGIRDMQTAAGYVRHGGNALALFLDGHVTSLSTTDTDTSNSESLKKLEQWFTL